MQIGLRDWLRFAVVLVSLSASIAFAGTRQNEDLKHYFSDIYLIGDSLSDQGNLFDAAALLTGSGIPAKDHYWKGRFANGENYAGLLAKQLRVPLKPSSKTRSGANFAYGGSRTDYNRVEDDATKPLETIQQFLARILPPALLQAVFPRQGGTFARGLFPWSLNLQREEFERRAVYDPDALYIVFHGSNDVGDLVPVGVLSTFAGLGFLDGLFVKPFINAAALGIRETVDAYVDAGARYIVVPKVPDIGKVPRVASQGGPAVSVATSLASSYNAAVDAELAAYAAQPDIHIIRPDTFGLLQRVVENPAAFGFSVADAPCFSGFVAADPAATVCAQPDDYVFWDSEHPTTALHAVLADFFLAETRKVVDTNSP